MTARLYPTIAAAIKAASRTAVAPLTWDPTSHLLSRFSFGPTTSSRAFVAAKGPDVWYRQMLTYAQQFPGYSAHRGVATQGPLLSMSPDDVRRYLKSQGREYGWDAMDQLTRVTLGLQTWSPSQLSEVLVDLFSNHLNVQNHNGDVWVTRHAYDRDVIRKHVTGSFTDMLVASSKHPAMLTYLNLAESTKTAINENYGRELLELHTVGLHYSESDVKSAARLLTGRTIDRTQSYVYNPRIHATGAVQILGFSHANDSSDAGEAGGDAMLRHLAAHPLTAQTLALKICRRFVSDAPSADLVDAVARAYLDNDTQILPMVSAILRSTEFWQSRGKKVRRPAENMIATLRALGVGVTAWPAALDTLTWMSAGMGNAPLEWPAPNGYPDVAAAWSSAGTLLDSWEHHLGFAGGWWKGLSTPDLPAMYAGARTSGQAVSLLTNRLTGMRWTSSHLATLQRFLDEPASTPMSRSVLRWMTYPLTAVILDGPHHALR